MSHNPLKYYTICYYFLILSIGLPVESFANGHAHLLSTTQETDTICTNNILDTLATFTIDKATGYDWQLPTGARIVSQLTDTSIVVDWQDAIIGTTQICVTAINDCGESSPFCTDISIQHCNAPPQALPDTQTTFFETATTILVQLNDMDPDGNDLVTLLDATSFPNSGMINLSNEAIIYTPQDEFTGIDSFQYVICDTGIPVQCDTNIVRVVVDHQAPIGRNDLITTPSNSSISIPVLNNDSDPEGSNLVIAIDTAAAPINGSLQLVDQEMVYTPNEGFTGTDRFEYIVCDSNVPVKCDRATVTVTVLNQSPIAVDDNYKIQAGTTNTLSVLNNDSDKENGKLTVMLQDIQMPQHGTVRTNGIEVVYISNQGFTGRDSFEYVVCDDGTPILCDTAQVFLQIINEAPIAMDDSQTTPSNTLISIEVLANDIDFEEGMLDVQLHPIDTAKNGSVSITENQIEYIPDDNFSGNDTLRYFICDDGSPVQCDTATVFITVLNASPMAQEDLIEVRSGDTICYSVLANDADKEGGVLLLDIAGIALPKNGEVQVIGEDICYTPDIGYSGIDSILYIICDDGEPIQCDSAFIIITVDNQAPVAIADTVTISSNEAICIPVLTNDIDAENGTLTVTLDVSKLPKHGIAAILEDEICYQPADRFSGIDSLCYIVCDDGIPSKCDTATIRIIIDNQAPIANDDELFINTNEEVCADVLANDVDAEAGALTVTLDENKLPKHGAVSIEDGKICYTPEENFSGIDSLCYIVCDDGVPAKCDTATIVIQINNQPPIAQDDIGVGLSDNELEILVLSNDLDLESGILSISSDTTNLPEHGEIQLLGDIFIYMPDEGFTGTDTFDYIICDNGTPSLCDTATTFLTIQNRAPVANEDIATTPSDTPVAIAILQNDDDPEQGELAISINPNFLTTNGSIELINDSIVYTPFRGFNGDDAFEYIICDDGIPSLCDTALVRILVLNDAPIAVEDVLTTPSNTTLIIDVTTNDYDPENGQLITTLETEALPKNGTVQVERGNFIYIPDLNFTGVDSFDYILCDDGVPMQCDTASVFITIENRAPIAESDQVITPFETPINIPFLINDSDPEEGNLTVLDSLEVIPENGTISITTNQLIYTPDEGFTGVDLFSYLLCDDGIPIQCDTALIRVTVPNTKPIAIDDYVTLPCVPFIMVGVLGNDSDAEHRLFTLSLEDTKRPPNGTATIIGDSIRYAPDGLFVGVDSFDYIICDTGTPILCDTATVFIQVNNDPPIAINDTFSIQEDQPLISNVLVNDSDPNDHPFYVLDSLLENPRLGSVSINANGELVYQPFSNVEGEDRFQYIICDEAIIFACDTATVFINIDELPDAPIAADDINITLKNISVSGNVLTNDSDPEEDEILVQPLPLTDPQFGSVILNADGSYIYTPLEDFVGKDQFIYEVCDDDSPSLCDTALVQLLVLEEENTINRPPLGVNDYLFSTINTTVSSNILANDADPDGDIISLITTPIEGPTLGKLTLLSSGQFQYEPEKDFTGKVTFSYAIIDLGSPTLMDTAIVTIEILPPSSNNIFAVDDAFLGQEDNTIRGNVLLNDFDPEGDDMTLSASPIQQPQNGTVILQEDGTFLYAPKPNYFGPDFFIYEVCDNGIATVCDEATVVLSVLPVNDTLCTQALPTPTIVANKIACINDTIHLFSPVPYPPIVLEEPDTSFLFIWFNGNGDTLAITKEAALFFAATDPLAIPPFSMKAQQGICFSGYSNFLNIEIIQLPDILITTTNFDNAICPGEALTLSANLQNDVQYQWTIKDSSRILSTNQELLIPSLDSTTTFELTVTSTTCDLGSTETIDIRLLPTPDATIIVEADSVICKGGRIVLSAIAESFTDYQYYWTGPKDFVSTSLTPVIENVSVDNNGLYHLLIENPLGCQSEQKTILIDQIKEPLSPPSISGQDRYCINEPIQLSILEKYETGTIIEWINEVDSVVGTGPTITLESTSLWTGALIRSRIIEAGCVSPVSDPFLINRSQPITAEIISSNNNLCKGSTTQLSAKTFDHATYEWRRLGSNTLFSDDQSTILANIQNELAVELTVYQTACPDTKVRDTLYLIFESNIDLQPTASFVLNGDCSPTNLTLDATISDSNLLFEWTGPNGFTSKLPVVTIEKVTSDFNGTYEVSVTDSSGCISTATLFINDLQETVRTPIITSVEGAVCENSNILLEAPSYEGTVVRYAWYENEELIPAVNQNRLFINDAKIGNSYSLEIAVDGCMLRSESFAPIVLEKPILSIGALPSIQCSNGDQSISIPTEIRNGQTPYDISWTGPNNFSSAIESPILNEVTSENAGTYELTVVDQNNCKSFAFTELTVQDGISTPVIEATDGTCLGESISLFATEYEGMEVQYNWEHPVGVIIDTLTTATLTIPSTREDNVGSYQVTATVGTCSSTSAVFDLNLTPRPAINPVAIYNGSLDCSSSNLELYANATDENLLYNWTGPNGFTSAIANPVIIGATPFNSGIYELRVENSSGCSMTKATNLIDQINTTQEKPVLQSTGIVCGGDIVTIEAPLYQGTAIQYNWLVNGTTIPNENTNSLSIQLDNEEENDYQLVVEVDGCILTSDPYIPTVNQMPEIRNITKSATYCEGEAVSLIAQSSIPSGQLIEYTWRGPNDFEFVKTTTSDSFLLQLPAISQAQAGSYTLSLKSGNCFSESRSVLITVNPGLLTPILEVEEAAICAGTQIQLSATSNVSLPVVYEWYLENSDGLELMASTATPNFTINNARSVHSGNYMVRMVSDKCPSNFSNQEYIIVFDVETIITPFSSVTSAEPGCLGDPIQLSVPFYPTATYEWHGPGGFQSNKHNPAIVQATTLDEGEYFVIIKMEGCDAVTSTAITIQLNPIPATPITTTNSPICQGDPLLVTIANATNYTSANTFQWYDSNNNLVAETPNPQASILEMPTDFSGELYAVATVGGCSSEPSSRTEVIISEGATLSIDAGADQQFCALNTAFLSATSPSSGEGSWTSLTGGIIEQINEANTTVQNLRDGSNLFVWTVSDPICGSVLTDTVEIFVGTTTQDRAIAGSDQQLCETNATQLDATSLVDATGRWIQSSDQISQGVSITSPTNPTTIIRGLLPGNTYQFNWIISIANCPDFDADQVVIQVDDIPDEKAIIPLEELALCTENEVRIEAEIPILSTGKWHIAHQDTGSDAITPESMIDIASPTNASILVENLPFGSHVLVWSLSNGGCQNFSTDSLFIYTQGSVVANPDDYIINFNDSLPLALLDNDQVANFEDSQLTITRYPEYGSIKELTDGTILYTPYQNYFGKDFFRYKLCSTLCEEVCDTAIVNIAITGVEGSGACFIPNTISPNNDGNNDVFLISCLDDFPNNQLSIFNRWGDKVYEAAPYNNNWQGDFDRQPLPAGTYFYVLKLTNEGEPLQGFISLFR